MQSPLPLILASTSAYRRELLARVRIPFECVPPGVDETPRPGEHASTLAARLARAKASAVAARQTAACVIGSDQVAVLLDGPHHGRMVGKPGSAANCIDQLSACSGRTLSFITAVAVARPDAPLCEFADDTRVKFRELDRTTIERYVANESPLDCAAGFKSEALGITLCESIDSADPTALIGLPLIRLCAVLRAAGFAV